MTERRLRLKGLRVGLWGRHELYVISLAALLSHRGADVRVLEDPDVSRTALQEGVEVLLLESPLPSELRRLPAGQPPVIVLSERTETDAGAGLPHATSAVLEKNASLSELTQAILDALRLPPPPIRELTPRQREVLELIAEGLDNAQIAARLGISQRTARAHVSGVLERLGVENRTQAAVAAVRRGWVA